MPGVLVFQVLDVVGQLLAAEEPAVQLTDVALGSRGAGRGQRDAVLLQLVVLHRRILRELPRACPEGGVLLADRAHEWLHLWKEREKSNYNLKKTKHSIEFMFTYCLHPVLGGSS